MPPAADTTCPGCGCAVTTDASEGLCAACLLMGVLTRGDLAGEEPPVEAPSMLRHCGDYEILNVLARGGMGVVFRARQRGLTREVALKMIAAADLAEPDDVRRFRLEAELIARLDHPNIVPVHAVGEHDGRPFFVMKLAERGTLAQQMTAKGPVHASDVRAAVELMVKVSRAVQFAHDHGVLHRDLKPGNILLDAAGEPLVSDFGLARLAQSPAGSRPSAVGAGTPAYMAPEQAGSSAAVTTASDVYGLGAVLYHLLTGRPPFPGETALEVLSRAANEEPVNPHSINPQTDRDLAIVCLKCLEKAPARRYASAAAFADDLERWLRGEPIAARAAGWAERTWKWAKRRPALATLAVTAVAATGILSAVLAAGNVMLRRERNYAREQESAALKGAALARASTARAEAGEQAMRLHVYASDIALARRALDDGHLGAARLSLARHVPQDGQPDLRGFEWYALHNLCHGQDRQTFSGFNTAVLSTAWSPDGLLMAVSGRDNLIRIYNSSDGSETAQLPLLKPQSKLADLALLAALPRRSPDTTALLAPGDGVTIDEMRMRSRPSSVGVVASMMWSPDGAWFLTAGEGSYVRVWKTADWSLQGFIPVKNCVQAEFTPDSRHIVLAVTGRAASQTGGEVRMYAAESLSRVLTVPNALSAFAIARDAGVLAAVEAGRTVRYFDLNTGGAMFSIPLGDDVFGLALSPDAARLAVLQDSTGTLRDAKTGATLCSLHPNGRRFRCLAFSPDGKLLATGCSGHTVQLFQGQTGMPISTLRGHDDEVLSLTFSPDGKKILTASNDHTARLWSASDPASSDPDILETGNLAAVALDGSRFLAVTRDGMVRCRDSDGKLTGATPSGPQRRVAGFTPDASRFVTLQLESGTVEWWHPDGTPDGPPITLPVPPDSYWTAAPAAGWIAIAAPREGPVLYDWRSGRVLRQLPIAPMKISRLEAPPDGSALLALAWPRAAARCDLASGLWQNIGAMSRGTVGPVVFSPDSRLMASSGDDNLITVRDAASGNVIATLRGHMAEIKSLAFSTDGRTLASASVDATIRLWHVPTWRELGPVRRGTLCTALRFVPHGLIAGEFEQRWLVIKGQP